MDVSTPVDDACRNEQTNDCNSFSNNCCCKGQCRENWISWTEISVGKCFHRQVYKGKGKGLDTCYSATYMSRTHDQQRFTISEVAADWHEPVVPQRIMWPSIASDNGQLDPRCS